MHPLRHVAAIADIPPPGFEFKILNRIAAALQVEPFVELRAVIDAGPRAAHPLLDELRAKRRPLQQEL